MRARALFAAALSGLLAARACLAASVADLAARADFSAVKTALAAGADAKALQPDGTTALHWAAQHDDENAVATLLSAGASADAINRYGVTPLALACVNGSAAVAARLLVAGADPNRVASGGETPLLVAARSGREALVRVLIARGADVNARLPGGGQTPLMWAAAEGHSAVVELLLAAGADACAALDSGFTALFFAARGGHRSTVAALLRSGGDVNDVTRPTRTGGKLPRRGTSALLLAIENGHFELALDLLERGADPNDQRSGYTPLHVMVWVRKADKGEDEGFPEPRVTGPVSSVQLVRRLVAAGARVNERLAGGPSGGGRIARKGATPFLLAADTADLEYMKLLLEFGADPMLANADGATPLMAAAGLGTRSAGEEAGTEEEAVEAVEYLLKLGADLNGVTVNGDTAMHGAAFANFPAIVHLLAARGMRFDVWYTKNKRGWTPLLIAEGHRFGHFKRAVESIDAFKRELGDRGCTPPPRTTGARVL
ncbi:MAG: ankyrin repeat domain-containing protein, partial [Opitutaceae bacterium]